MKLIDIDKKRQEKKDKKKKEAKDKKAPALHCTNIGRDGKKYYQFSVNYAYKEKNWTFDIWATSKKDAEKRMHAIKHHPVETIQVIDSGIWDGTF